jgi:hypothetical protein
MGLTSTPVNDLTKEPALATGGAITTVTGVSALALSLWPNLISDAKLNVILVVAAFLLPLITAVFTRGKVWSPATVQEVLDEAVAQALAQQHKDNLTVKKDKPDPPRILGSGN